MPSPIEPERPAISAAVIACCTGPVSDRSRELPTGAELMAAFRLGNVQMAGGDFLFQSDIAEALIALGDQNVMPELREDLRSRVRETRVNAAWVLAKLGDPSGVELVIAEALDRSRDEREVDPVTEPNLLARRISSAIRQDRYYAIRTLGFIGDSRAAPMLCELVCDGEFDHAAAYALSQIGDPSCVETLVDAAAARPGRRVSLARAAALLGSRRGVDILITVLRDAKAHPVDKERAAEALGSTRSSSVVASLIEALRDPAIDARLGAARALGEIGDPSALPALTEALQDAAQTASHGPPVTLREVARHAIGKIEAARKDRP